MVLGSRVLGSRVLGSPDIGHHRGHGCGGRRCHQLLGLGRVTLRRSDRSRGADDDLERVDRKDAGHHGEGRLDRLRAGHLEGEPLHAFDGDIAQDPVGHPSEFLTGGHPLDSGGSADDEAHAALGIARGRGEDEIGR